LPIWLGSVISAPFIARLIRAAVAMSLPVVSLRK
jgi:hypothetical protein